MTFNEFMEDGHSLKDKLSHAFLIDCGPNKLRLKSVDVVQPEKSYPECMILQTPYEYTVNIVCEFYEGPNAGMEFPSTFQVPKMCDKGFLLQSHSGLKWRSAINIGTIDYIIKAYGSEGSPTFNLAFNKTLNLYINPSHGSDGKFIPPRIVLNKYNTNGTIIQYDLYEYLVSAGIPESDVNKYLIKVPENNRSVDASSYLTTYAPIPIGVSSSYEDLPERFRNKGLQLTGIDNLCSSTNPYITTNYLYQILVAYNIDPINFELFSPFDVKFNTFQDILFGAEFTAGYFKHKIGTVLKEDKLSTAQIRGEPLTARIRSIFSMHDTVYNTVQSASTSNAAAFLSQTNKIYFQEKNKNKKSLKYTNDFYGLVCSSKTPENVSLCNVKNELANDVVLSEGEPKIRLMDKLGNIIIIPYSEYYRSRILSIDNYDYYEKKVTPDKNGNIKIFRSGKFHTVKYTGDDTWDYMRDIPESGMALNTGLIPMANRCDGVRMSMSTNMIDQCIPIEGSRPPVIGTSVYKDIYNRSDLNYKSEVDGVVEGVIDNYIKVRLDNGSSKIITTPPAQQSNAHTFNRFRPAVKAGDRITKGTVLMESDSFKDKSLSITTPLKVAYMMYGARTDEDAIIISEYASKQLAHAIDKEIRIEIPRTSRVLFNKDRLLSIMGSNSETPLDSEAIKLLNGLNEFGLPEVGKTYYKGQKLFMYGKDYPEDSKSAALLKLIERRSDSSVETDSIYDVQIGGIPYGLQECVVTSVKVFGSPSRFNDIEFLKVYNYYKNINDNKLAEIKSVLGNFEVPEYKINLSDKSKSCPNTIVIIINTRSINYAKKGDKIANRFGSKGTISEVLPDMECPRIGGPNGERVDIIMPAQSTLNRKNMAQLMEVNLCEVSGMAYKLNTENIMNQNYDKVREALNMLYQTSKFSIYSDKELVEYHNKFKNFYDINVGAIDKKYTPDVLTKISKYFNYRIEGYYVYIPKFDSMTKNTVLTGTTEIMRLHFVPEWKAKSTANTEFNNDLVLGIGSGKSGGQKIGQMETWQLMAYNTMDEFYHLSNKDDGMDRAYDRTLGEIVTSMRLIGLNVSGYEDTI